MWMGTMSQTFICYTMIVLCSNKAGLTQFFEPKSDFMGPEVAHVGQINLICCILLLLMMMILIYVMTLISLIHLTRLDRSEWSIQFKKGYFSRGQWTTQVSLGVTSFQQAPPWWPLLNVTCTLVSAVYFTAGLSVCSFSFYLTNPFILC